MQFIMAKLNKSNLKFTIDLLPAFLILLALKLTILPSLSWWIVLIPILIIPGLIIGWIAFFILAQFFILIIELIDDFYYKIKNKFKK